MGHLIAVAGPKGGSGSTTFSLVLAAALRKLHGGKVALVEGDLLWGDLATVAGLKPYRSLLDILDKPRPWTPNLVAPAIDRHPLLDFDMVLAPAESHLAEKIQTKDYCEFLDVLIQSHDFVVVDLPPSLGDPTLETLERAAGIYLMVPPSPAGVAVTRKMVRVCSLLRRPMRKLGVILNDAPLTSSTTLTRQQVEDGLGVPVILQVPRATAGELELHALKAIDPISPRGEALKAIIGFAKTLRADLTSGRKATGTSQGLEARTPSFDPAVAVAGEDISKPPTPRPGPAPQAAPAPPGATAGTPGSGSQDLPVEPSSATAGGRDPRRTTLNMSLRERLAKARALGLEDPARWGPPGSPEPAPRAAPSPTPLPPPAPPRGPTPLPPPGGARPAKKPSPEVARDPNRLGLVIADDSDTFRRGLARALAFEDGLQVLAEAKDGVEVLELCAAYQPDAALLDLNMPLLNGFEACRQIRERFPTIQVFLMSVQGDAGTVEKATQHGAAGFLLKPFPPEEVTRVLRPLIRRK